MTAVEPVSGKIGDVLTIQRTLADRMKPYDRRPFVRLASKPAIGCL